MASEYDFARTSTCSRASFRNWRIIIRFTQNIITMIVIARIKRLSFILNSLFISVKTTQKYHYPRVIVQLETWASLVREQVSDVDLIIFYLDFRVNFPNFEASIFSTRYDITIIIA